jgi:hypothetical protein
MDPHLKPLDKELFYKYLKQSTNYMEYGSGGSTYQAAILNNIETVISVESTYSWIEKIKSKINETSPDCLNKLDFKFIDLKASNTGWGHPGKESTKEERDKYSNVICDLDKTQVDKIDLILIDGRFRVACALKCFDKIKDDCILIIDDFIERAHYKIVLQFYDIIEKTINNSMVVLQKKKCEKPSDELIKKYEDDVQ